MADEGNVITDLDLDNPGNGEDSLPSAGIIAQYIKDLSVENPNSPDCFQWQEAPQLDVQFNIQARAVNAEVQEVEMKIQVSAKAPAGTAYLVDLSYAGLIGMRNLDEAQAHAFIYAEAPRILFPFARRIVADAVRDAGFAPLMLEPIDFNGLYVQQLEAQQQGAQDQPVAGSA
jgi:preprotein translocase subunit SecB